MYDLVFTIGQDVKRRASLCYYLNNHRTFAEPFENIDEFMRCWPRSGVILIHDEQNAVAALMHEIASRHAWLPVIAFSEEPEPECVVMVEPYRGFTSRRRYRPQAPTPGLPPHRADMNDRSG